MLPNRGSSLPFIARWASISSASSRSKRDRLSRYQIRRQSSLMCLSLITPRGFAPRTPRHARSRGPARPTPLAWAHSRARSPLSDPVLKLLLAPGLLVLVRSNTRQYSVEVRLRCGLECAGETEVCGESVG